MMMERNVDFLWHDNTQDKQVMTVFEAGNQPKNRVIQLIYQEQNRHLEIIINMTMNQRKWTFL